MAHIRAMKTCFKCGTSKSLDCFYVHKMMADGHLNKCKDCTKNDTRLRLEQKVNDPHWLAKERERCRVKQQKYRELGCASLVKKETRQKWSDGNRSKIKAQREAREALKKGIIVRQLFCNRCGSRQEIMEMHHNDYAKPLAIEWLCLSCHGKTRRKQFGEPLAKRK